ncbi:hypothetical protein Dimus_024402 [Dionaea muscipula]
MGVMMVNAAENVEGMQEEKDQQVIMLEKRIREVEIEKEEKERTSTENRSQELGRSTIQKLQEDMDSLQRDLDAKIANESGAINNLNCNALGPLPRTHHLAWTRKALKDAEKQVDTQNEVVRGLREEVPRPKDILELNKERRKDMTGLLNEYDERIQVNTIREFINSKPFENGMVRVISPW